MSAKVTNTDDIAHDKNYVYYHNPVTDRWQVHPWDVDLLEPMTNIGEGDHLFTIDVLSHPEFRPGYFNCAQEILDWLFNGERTGQLIDHWAHFIHDPHELDFATADAALWNHHPETRSRARYYRRHGQTANVSDFIDEMKTYIDKRRRYLPLLLQPGESVVLS